MEEVILKMEHISKSFGGVHALKDVELTVKRGEVVGLLGENGAGKSTLMKVLLGLHQPDSGTVLFKGREVHYRSPADALTDGISMIHQEISLVPTLTIAENVWLGREKKFMTHGFIDDKLRSRKTKELLDSIGMELDPKMLVGKLSIAQMQMVEIVRAISYESDLIIMDEPTSALTDKEVDILFNVVRKLSAEGTAVIFITHKMDEVFVICDTLVVFRDGRYIDTKPAKETTQHELISLIAGRELSEMFPKEKAEIGEVVLEVEHLTGKGFRDISFQLHRGEILGLSGLVGAGRTEVVSAIFGLDKYTSGTIRVKGKEVRFRSCKDAVRHGIAMVTEDRLRQGAIHRLSVLTNTTLANFDAYTNRLGVYDRRKERESCDEEMKTMAVALASIDQEMQSLSGGNQQKVIIGRWLMTDPEILILDEPTRGIDVGSKAEIHRMISKLAQKGLAILLVSSEMPEILGMSDRIIVLHEGDQCYECTREEADQEIIMTHAFGLK